MTNWHQAPTKVTARPAEVTDVTRAAAVPTLAHERRRHPRLGSTSALQAELSLSMDIEILDLSDGGVLLTCDCPLEVGYRMPLQILLPRDPFVTSIEVRRVEEVQSTPGGSRRYLIGAAFTSLDGKSARVLRQFLPSHPQTTRRTSR